MKYFKSILLVAITLLFFQCSKDDLVTMSYYQTSCADKWGYDPDTPTGEAVINYFDTEFGVTIETVVVTTDNSIAEACLACSCLSGKVITVEVDEEHVDLLESENFFQ